MASKGTSVLVPLLYVIAVFGGLYIFSTWYKKRIATRLAEPYFASHPDRDLYVTLLGRTDPPTSDALLKSALVRRAMADVQRVLKIREDKPAIQNLLQKGSVGDDLWNSLLAAEKELEAEIMEVVAEANTFVDGWGTVIFQTANEMIANEKMRQSFEQTAELRAEKELKYGKTKAIDAQIPTPQAISSTLAALPSGPTSTPSKPIPPKPIPKAANGSTNTSSAGAETPAEHAASSATGTPSKSPSKKGKKRK